MTDGVAREMMNLLERERVCLLSGRFDDLEALGPQKQLLIESCAEDELDVQAMNEILVAADRNKRLFKAAMEGLASVRDRMTEARRAAEGSTYGRDGRLRPGKGTTTGQRI